MLEINQIYNGDCLELMQNIPDNSIDCIICDLPYGTTACSWDSIIPFDKLWEQYKRIRKPNCPIVLFAQEPFASYLRLSNIKEYKYDWIWEKDRCPNFMMSKYVPLKKTELICVFSDCGINTNCKTKMKYYPQGLKPLNKKIKSNCAKKGVNIYNCLNKEYVQEWTNYPTNIIKCPTEAGLHPTQKPVTLIEYLIKTYSNENDLILDNCSGSGTLAIACHNLKRRFICIEKDYDYWKASVERLENAQAQMKLF